MAALHSPPMSTDTDSNKDWIIHCLANLEGWQHIDAAALPLTSEPTLESIHLRVCRVEQLYAITSPPPMLASTWASLEFRIFRLRSQWRPGDRLPRTAEPAHGPEDPTEAVSTVCSILHGFSTMLPRALLQDLDQDLAELKELGTTTSATRIAKHVDEGPDVAKVSEDDAETALDPEDSMHGFILKLWQCLSWTAGRLHRPLPTQQEAQGLKGLYIFALELAILTPFPDKVIPTYKPPVPAAYVAPAPLPRPRPPVGRFPLPSQVLPVRGASSKCSYCKHCCATSCARNRPPVVEVSRSAKSKSRARKWWNGFKWWCSGRKLRRTRTYSSTSSLASYDI